MQPCGSPPRAIVAAADSSTKHAGASDARITTMVFLTMVDIWRETVEELGGLRGFFYIFLVMVVFTLIVQWAVGRASATRAAKRMNRQRMRKLR